MSLKKKIINAGSWTFAGHIASQGIRLLSNLIMTRLLAPEMFGIMAIANIVIIGLAMFSDLGLRQNIIQSKRGNEPLFLNTIWSIQIIRGAALAIFCVLASYILTVLNGMQLIGPESVYSSSLLSDVLYVLALAPFIQGLESTKVATANRSLALKKIITLELIAQLCGLVFMLIWISFERSIWALVYGALIASFVKMLLGHLTLDGHQNIPQWDKKAFNEIFHFGKWMFLSSIMGFLINQGDKLLLGGVMTSTSFGLYSIAALLFSSLQVLVSKMISSVVYPALGEVQRTEPNKILEKYYKLRLPIDIFCLVVAGFIFYSGTTVVSILYDDRYLASGYMLQILSLVFIVIRFGVAGQFYLVMGQPKIMTILMLSRLVFMLTLVPVGDMFAGDIGAVWGVVVAYFPGLILTFFYKKRFGLIDIKKELHVIPFFFVGLLAGFIFDWAVSLFTVSMLI